MTEIPTIEVDSQVGYWRILKIVHRRALCRCRCGRVCEVSTDALASGESTSCGCSATSRPKSSQAFQLPDWRPQR